MNKYFDNTVEKKPSPSHRSLDIDKASCAGILVAV